MHTHQLQLQSKFQSIGEQLCVVSAFKSLFSLLKYNFYLALNLDLKREMPSLLFIHLLVYLTATVHINKHCCKAPVLAKRLYFICSPWTHLTKSLYEQNISLKQQSH